MENKLNDNQAIILAGTYSEKPSAKFKNYVPTNVFVAVNEVAKKNGGSYSKDAKQFLFKTA